MKRKRSPPTKTLSIIFYGFSLIAKEKIMQRILTTLIFIIAATAASASICYSLCSVEGNAYLEFENDHSDITVKGCKCFWPYTCYETETNIYGHYELDLGITGRYEFFLIPPSYKWESIYSDTCYRIIGHVIFPFPDTLVATLPRVSVEIESHTFPVQVAPGGCFDYTGILRNNYGKSITVDLWSMVQLPGGDWYGPLWVYHNIPMSGNEEMVEPNASQCVPVGAAPGEYKFCVFTGDYQSEPLVIDSSCFNFTVTSALARSGIDDWNSPGWFKEDSDSKPADYDLLGNYPNPFNATTTIQFDLEKESQVSLDVYDILGRKVTTLAEGVHQAGEHKVNWDASTYSSGVYFYKLTTNDKTFTKRMTLLK
ncbi:MAG: T9SS type A sorting domain-containing protein [bacterium]|nr:T9SS type A sorting domain-containing protein [bacterium]